MAEAKKTILLLSRRDPQEAMRVAAGLTIFGHAVRMVFTGAPLTSQTMDSEAAELLELADIEPQTTIPEMSELLDLLDSQAMTDLLTDADEVINI